MDSLPLAILPQFIFFKVPWQVDRKISEGKGILKPLLLGSAALHSFHQNMSLPFNIFCVCVHRPAWSPSKSLESAVFIIIAL